MLLSSLECKILMTSFLTCLKNNDADHFPCRSASADYLKCRMDKNLMAKDDLSKLGLGETMAYERKSVSEGEKEGKGFIAGTGVKSSSKGFFNFFK